MKKFLSLLTAFISVFTLTGVTSYAEEIYGDATCDGVVNLCDLTALNQHIVKIQQLSDDGIKNCDFFSDNEIGIRNLSFLKSHLIGVTDTLSTLNSELTYEVKKYLHYYECKGEFRITNYDYFLQLCENGQISSRLKHYYNEEFFKDNVLCLAGYSKDNINDYYFESGAFKNDGLINENNKLTLTTSVSPFCDSLGNYHRKLDLHDTLAVHISKNCYSGEEFESVVNEYGTGALFFSYQYEPLTMNSFDAEDMKITTYDQFIELKESGKLPESFELDQLFFEYNLLFITKPISHSGSNILDFDGVEETATGFNFSASVKAPYLSPLTADVVLTSYAVTIPKNMDGGYMEYAEYSFTYNDAYCDENNRIDFNISEYDFESSEFNLEECDVVASCEELEKANIIVKNENGEVKNLSEIYTEEFFEKNVLCFTRKFDNSYIEKVEATDDVINLYSFHGTEEADRLVVLEVENSTYEGQFLQLF